MVTAALRRMFVVHFAVDLLFALPLFFAPQLTLGLFGWEEVDPIATRIVAAALFGIGIQSLLSRKASAETFRELLSLKIIWSSTAAVGIAWGTLETGNRAGWLFAAIFAVFCGVWTTFRVRLGSAHVPELPVSPVAGGAGGE